VHGLVTTSRAYVPPPPAREVEGEEDPEEGDEESGGGGDEESECESEDEDDDAEASEGILTSVVNAGPLAKVMAREISPASALTTTSAASMFFVLPAHARQEPIRG
jgi:hypothetical protein